MEKIKINVAGVPYTIATDNDEKYTLELAAEIDSQIKKIMAAGCAPTQAMVLTLLNYADNARKYDKEVENTKAQLKEYLADAAQAKSERDMLKRELAKVKKANHGEF